MDTAVAIIEAAPVAETWTEIRCIACVPLGWYASHLLLRVEGAMNANGAKLELKCPRCKSLVLWTFGKPEFRVIVQGNRNHRKQTAVYE